MKAVPYTYTTPKWDYNPQTRRREKIGMEERTVEAASMFDVNKAIMRCLVKNLAMFGLGLYVYAGEDLPEDAAPQPESEPQKQPKPKSATPKQEQPPMPCICARCNQPIKRVKLKDALHLFCLLGFSHNFKVFNAGRFPDPPSSTYFFSISYAF